MRLLFGIAIAFLLLIAALAVFVWSGRYDVAATVPHSNIVAWLMEEARDRSIEFHSRGIQPRALNDRELTKTGFNEYHAMCRLCHGAPGYPPNEFAQGLYPKPPDWGAKIMKELSEAELYWIVRNGIKMTGMPAFGPTHKDEELWAIVAFWKRMTRMQPKEYKVMSKEVEGEKEAEDPHHHHGTKKH